MHKFTRSLLAAFVAATAFAAQANDPAATQANDPAAKSTHKCVAADGKELRSTDNKPITSKADCDKQGGKLEAAPKG
jgi:hypothetical protein